MPLVRIEMLEGRPVEYRKAILDGVHSALVEAFQIPPGNRNQVLHELSRENFEVMEGKSPAFLSIELTVFPGRSLDAKRKLYAAIVRNLSERPGISPADMIIVLREPPLTDWGIGGGKMASEVPLGFKVDV